MLVDELLYALSEMRQRLMQVDTAYTPGAAYRRLSVIGNIRSYVMGDNPEGFTDYCQRSLVTSDCDLMVDLLDELYEELSMPNNSTWDEFDAQFLKVVA